MFSEKNLDNTNLPNKIDDIGFKKSLLNIVGIPSIFFIISMLFTHFQFEYKENIRKEISELIKLKLDVSEYLRYFVDMETGVRGYIITKNPKFLEPYLEAIKLKEIIKKRIYIKTSENYLLQLNFNHLVDASDNWTYKYPQLAIDKRKNNAYLSDEIRNEAKSAFDVIRNEFRKLNSDIDDLSNDLDKKMQFANFITYFLEFILIISFISFIYFLLKKQFNILTTNYKNIAIQNVKQLDKLAEASNLKDLFLANMSHEIRTPLGAILGFIDLALEDEHLKPDTRGHLSFVKRNGSHLLNLIDDLFDLSKVNSNVIEINSEKIDLLQVLLDVKNNFSAIIDNNKQNIKFVIIDDIPKIIHADVLRLKQILINLLSNSIKFTKVNGNINLKISFINENIIFDLFDEGIGIPEISKDLIFNTFHQVESGHSRTYSGSGLGLSISRKLANLMGGSLELISSQLGVGSLFRLILPQNLRSSELYFSQNDFETYDIFFKNQELETLKTNTSIKLLKDKRILLVEDSKENQILFKIYLDSEGALVDMVDSGADAFKFGLKMNYDIILMDIQMPGIDGYQALRLLRSSGYLGKIMALTAHAMKGEKEKCLAAGFDGYLSKPVNKIKFIKYIKDLIS